MVERRPIGRVRIASGRLIAADPDALSEPADDEDGEAREVAGAVTISLGRCGTFPIFFEYEDGLPTRLIVQLI